MKLKNSHKYVVTIGLCARKFAEIKNETMESIVRQDYPHLDMELILVLSERSSAPNHIVEIFSRASLKTRVYCDFGKGLATARQIVVEKAEGEYIVWVDSDVTLSTGFVRKQVEFLRSNPDVSVSIGQYNTVELEGKFFANVVSLFMSLLKIVTFGATITRAESLRGVGGFDRRIRGASEDVDIVMRLVNNDWRITVNRDAEFFHKERETLRDVFDRGVWYGRGGHFLNHKYSALTRIPYRLPPVYLLWGLKLSLKSYRKHFDRKSFFIPLVSLFQSIGWSVGYVKAHLAGYGHSISTHEISAVQTRNTQKKIRAMLGHA